jgi:hypothetical protein
MAATVLTFVIVGQQDHPIYEVDLTGPKEVRQRGRRAQPTRPRFASPFEHATPTTTRVRCRAQQQAQYLHQFVLHAALDAVDEAMWATKELFLKVRPRKRQRGQRVGVGFRGGWSLSAPPPAGLPQPPRAAHDPVAHATVARPQTVDRFNNLFVSAFVTPGGARLLLLHDGRGDDGVRAFFGEVYELYLRVRCVSV